MTEEDCRRRIRCMMSDRTGELRFEAFEIVDAPQCAATVERIRQYLLGRPLAEVDPGRIREIGRDENPLCARVVAQMVAESRRTFVRPPGTELQRERQETA